MPRFPRAFLRGHPHHIVRRGHDRKPVFAHDDDFRVYLDNLTEQIERLEIGVIAYCLMTNHVHLLLQPEHDGHDLSLLMRVLAGRQTRYVNRLEQRTGTLWEGRFKCSLVDSIEYLLACCRYIELNPVRAGIVATAGNYRWSSYRQRTTSQVAEIPLIASACFVSLGQNEAERQRRYRDYVAGDCSNAELEIIRTAAHRNQLTGVEHFKREIEQKLSRRLSHRQPGRPG